MNEYECILNESTGDRPYSLLMNMSRVQHLGCTPSRAYHAVLVRSVLATGRIE